MEPTRYDVVTSDGRTLETYAVAGTDAALLFIPGTPCAGLPFRPAVEAARWAGLGFITYSRPGYSTSTRRAGRSVADCVADVETIATTLEVERLHVVGWSGGGPHALACGALLKGVVASVATIAGVAPWGASGLDWLAGMAPENHEEFGAALAGEEALEEHLRPAAAQLRSITADAIANVLGGLVGEADKTALTGEFAEYSAATFRAAVSAGIWGWLDDDLAFTRDWGFPLSSISVPVTVWQGDDDRMVPFAHGAWLADAVPNASPRLLAGEGHLSLGVTRFPEIVAGLVSEQ